MRAMRVLAALCLAALAGCDQIEAVVDETLALVDEAADKGGTDVPESARAPLDPETEDALRRRISGQSFN